MADPRMPTGHDCNTFCDTGAGIHSEVIYTNTVTPFTTQQGLEREFSQLYGLAILRVEQAREAEDFADIPEDSRDYIAKPDPAKANAVLAAINKLIGSVFPKMSYTPEYPWLVYFGKPEDVAMAKATPKLADSGNSDDDDEPVAY